MVLRSPTVLPATTSTTNEYVVSHYQLVITPLSSEQWAAERTNTGWVCRRRCRLVQGRTYHCVYTSWVTRALHLVSYMTVCLFALLNIGRCNWSFIRVSLQGVRLWNKSPLGLEGAESVACYWLMLQDGQVTSQLAQGQQQLYVALSGRPHLELQPAPVRPSVCLSVPCLTFTRNRKAIETSNLEETWVHDLNTSSLTGEEM